MFFGVMPSAGSFPFVGAIVVAIHGLFVALLCIQYSPHLPTVAQKVKVQTYFLQPQLKEEEKKVASVPKQVPAAPKITPQPAPTAPIKAPERKSEPLQKKTQPQPPSQPGKAAPVKTAAPAPSVAAQPQASHESVNQGERQKIAEAQKKLSHIKSALSAISIQALPVAPEIELPASSFPVSPEDLAEDFSSSSATGESLYIEELSRRLRTFLTLPERGQMVIELTVGRGGKVAQLKILNGDNSANRRYIEQNILNMTFSGFGPYFGNQENHTFTIELQSE